MGLVLRFKTKLPAQLLGGTGIRIDKNGAVLSTNLDYTSFAELSGSLDPSNSLIGIYNKSTGQWYTLPISTLISGGQVDLETGVTGTLPVLNGGTGASSASVARTNLGVAIGSDVQAYNANLAAFSGLSGVAGRVPYFTGPGATALFDSTTFGRSVSNVADASALRTLAGSVIGTDVAAQSHVGSGGVAHANVVAAGAAGFMTGTDKTKLDGISAGADVTATVIHAATGKTTPVDNDELGLIDSAASNVLKKVLWSNVKATLKTYFDTLYTGGGGGASADDTRQWLLAAARASKGLAQATYLIDGWADGYGSTDGINGGASSGYTYVSGGRYVSVGYDTAATDQAIGFGTGATIGNYTDGAGNAVIFDGNSSQNTSGPTAAGKFTATTGYFGKNYSASPKKITKAILVKPTDSDFTGNQTTITFNLRYKNGSLPSGPTDGTLLGTTGSVSDSVSPVTITSSITNTNFDYVFVEAISPGSTNLWMAECTFYEPITPTADDGILQTVAKTTDFVPAQVKVILEVEPIESITLGTDLTVQASRNGGTNFTTASSTTQLHTLGNRSFIEAVVNVSAQPSGSSVCTKISYLNDKEARQHAMVETWSA